MTSEPAAITGPLDFGQAGVIGSVNQQGRLMAVSAYHARYGIVTLTSAPPFAEDDRYRTESVRAYRRGLAALDGFGLVFDAPVVRREALLLDDITPVVRLWLGDGTYAECVTWATSQGVVQRWRFSGDVPGARISGRVWLQRAAYTQLTEGGPLPMPSTRSEVFQADEFAGLENPALGWAVCFDGVDCTPLDDGSAQLSGAVAGDESWTLVIGMGANRDEACANASQLRDSPPPEPVAWGDVPPDPLLRRGLVYGRMCCVPVESESVCILTDHMLLPLSWNRDAYYVARALLAWAQCDPAQADLFDVVRGHLIWMFETAQRMDGLWGRSYLANGRIKDQGFQLDQQLFPLLELADYVQLTGDRQILERLRAQIPALFAALRPYRLDDRPLYATDETPADDPIALPYHLSSHVLLWRALRLLDALGVNCGPDAPSAQAVRETVLRDFVIEHGGVRLFAYAIDESGRYHLYHDANDIPLALAPAWGFCDMGDPVWRATVDFAFSPANAGGFYAGRLGSVHTMAPWPLGDVQDLIIARALGDEARAGRARAQLLRAAGPGGALPEAYDADSGAVVSRHWFAWPNAAYACVELGAFDDGLADLG